MLGPALIQKEVLYAIRASPRKPRFWSLIRIPQVYKPPIQPSVHHSPKSRAPRGLSPKNLRKIRDPNLVKNSRPEASNSAHNPDTKSVTCHATTSLKVQARRKIENPHLILLHRPMVAHATGFTSSTSSPRPHVPEETRSLTTRR